AASHRALDADLAALRVHDRAADREPEAEAAGLIADLARAEEPLEEPRLLVSWDARTFVSHGDADVPILRRARDEHFRRFGRVLARVREQIREHLPGAARIGQDAIRAGVELRHDR